MSIHEGHRKRIRERFRASGLDAFADHEALELLLFYTRSRGDVNALAHRLLDTFNSLHGVFEASVDQLLMVHGVGEETAILLSLVLQLFRRYHESLLKKQTSLPCRKDAERYCLALLIGLQQEQFCVVSLNAANQIQGTKVVAHGSINEVSANPRSVMEAALNLKAHNILLCHNHPGGSLEPSAADRNATKRIQESLESVGINVLDHIIVAGGRTYSMAQHGDLTQTTYEKKTDEGIIMSPQRNTWDGKG